MSAGLSAAAIGGIAAGVGSVAGAVISSQASKSAANTQAQSAANASQAELQAANNAIAAQQQAGEAAQANQQPWINAGSAALSQLGNLLGIPIQASGQYTAQATSQGGGGGIGGSAGGPGLVQMSNGVPTMNQQLYQSNPAYKAAWDQVAAANQARFGTGYTTASDPNQLSQELQQYLGPQGLASINQTTGTAGTFQPGTVYGGATGGFSGATGQFDPNSFGGQAKQNLSNLMGFNGADPTAALRATPGYQFALSQGLQGVENSAAARGMQLSGATLKDLNNYAQGTADQTYQQQLQNAQSIYNTDVGNLMQVAGLGSSNAGTASGNTVATGANIGSTLTNAGSQIGSNIIGAGNAQAAGQVGAANALGGSVNSLGQIYQLGQLFGNGGGGGASSGGFNFSTGLPQDSSYGVTYPMSATGY